MLRPARVGLLTATPTVGDIRNAVQVATSAWGGRYFPIVDIDRGKRLVRRFEQLSVDVLWSLTQNDAAEELATQAGFEWRGRSPYGPFDPPGDGPSTRLLEPHHLARSVSAVGALATWSPDDPLAALLAVWLGDFATHEYGEMCRERFAGIARTVVVEPGVELDPDLVRLISPITATAMDIDYTGEGPGPGFVVVNPENPTDLLRFWNIRASGGNVVPWVLYAEERLEPAIEAWLEALLVAGGVPRWSHGDGTPGSLYLGVTPFVDKDSVPPTLKRLLDGQSIELLPGHEGRGGWRDMHPLSTEFRRTFSVDVDPRVGSVELPLPSLPWASGRPPSQWPGIIAAEVTVSAENGLDPERTTAVPRVRRLASLLDSRGVSDDSFCRPNGHGGVYSVRAAEGTVLLILSHPVAVFEGLFNQDGWTLEQSDDGRFASRLDHRLGGVTYELANQPAAREILLRAAKRGDLGSEFDTLRSLAVTKRGAWPDGLMDRRTPEEYARGLIFKLAEQRLLRATLPLTCPSCRNVFALDSDELADELTCGFCDHRFPLALVLAWLGPKAKWRYRIAGHVSEARLRAALPVIATTAVLAKLARGGFDTCIDAKGLKIRRSGQEFAEFDIATVVDTFRPTVVLGEVKAHGEINAGDIANLSLAQQALRENGVECFILVATLKAAFSSDETDLLRSYCEQSAELLVSDYTQAPLALPLTFTSDQLSAGWLSEEHPWRWGEHWRGVAATARASCMRNLGLEEIQPVGSLAERSFDFRWKRDAAVRLPELRRDQ